MTMLVHRVPVVAEASVSLAQIKTHLRVDFSDDDALIDAIGATAAAEIEQFAQIALLTQTIRVTIFDPVQESGLRLPIGPVDDNDVPTVTIDGVAFTAFDFVGGNRAYIRWKADYFDLSPCRISVEYQAGFGGQADIPDDLQQAILDQAALHYDGRSPMDAKALTTSPHMARIGARYRGVQL